MNRSKVDKIMGVTVIEFDELEQLKKDRLDFGFDSVYFRYAIAIDQLACLKEKELKKDGISFNKKAWSDNQKMHFYKVLEQLVHTHEESKQ